MDKEATSPAATLDGGDLDCGSGLLLLIRKAIDPLEPGQLLELFSTEISVSEDLPAWCRLTGNRLVDASKDAGRHRFLIAKREAAPSVSGSNAGRPAIPISKPATVNRFAKKIEPLSVMGIGSWPRPRWLIQALHEHLERRLSDRDFEATANDAVRLAVDAQLRAGVDVITDGEQRRDNYAGFVGALLDGCQLVPIADLAAYVDDPEQFAKELAALEVPALEVRHPAVFGPIRRTRPLVLGEVQFLQSISDNPVKVALPGPYLLTRTMWMECVSDKAYERREDLARDVVAALREELTELLAAGVSLVQFDEPVLTEAAFGNQNVKQRTFMCGALGEKLAPEAELAFAQSLLLELLAGFPTDRTALHICRGNWSKNEEIALSGDYRPLMNLLKGVPVGTYFLELCTPRAGELEVLASLPDDRRVGVGVVNQKLDEVESVEAIVERGRKAIHLFGVERVLLNPDCGFATFADAPLAHAEVAEAKLKAIADAARLLRKEFRVSES